MKVLTWCARVCTGASNGEIQGVLLRGVYHRGRRRRLHSWHERLPTRRQVLHTHTHTTTTQHSEHTACLCASACLPACLSVCLCLSVSKYNTRGADSL